MQHAKKMMLVDPRFVRPTMRDKSLSALDTEIASTLESDEPDDEKAKRYISTLKKFKYHEELPVPPVKKIDKLESSVLDSMPPNQRYKAKRMLNLLRNNPEVDFNDKGELIYRQSSIPNSDIVDLIGDATRSKSSEDPVGWQEFAQSLKVSKPRREVMPNTRIWNYMRGATRGRTPRYPRWIEG